MHYHLEVIMPPTTDISAALDGILKPFDENCEDEDLRSLTFWDWFVIGGRWAGEKESCRYDAEKLELFYKQLRDKGVTVSGFVAGKETLQPASQIPMVDKMWNDLFPTEDGTITPCPIFSHSNNQYDSNSLLSCDICMVSEIPEKLTSSRVIFASHRYGDSGVEAKFMLSKEEWNGVNHQNTDWGGSVAEALSRYKQRLSGYSKEYREKHTPADNWICVTVDYHS